MIFLEEESRVAHSLQYFESEGLSTSHLGHLMVNHPKLLIRQKDYQFGWGVSNWYGLKYHGQEAERHKLFQL